MPGGRLRLDPLRTQDQHSPEDKPPYPLAQVIVPKNARPFRRRGQVPSTALKARRSAHKRRSFCSKSLSEQPNRLRLIWILKSALPLLELGMAISGRISTHRRRPDFPDRLFCNQNIMDTLFVDPQSGGEAVNGIIYLVGLVVIVLFILSFFGLR